MARDAIELSIAVRRDGKEGAARKFDSRIEPRLAYEGSAA